MFKVGHTQVWLDWLCYLSGNSQTAPTIFFKLSAYVFKIISLRIHKPQSPSHFWHIISQLQVVCTNFTFHDHLKSEINKQITLNILFPSVCRNCCITSSTELQLKANHQCTLIYWEILRCSYCLICTILGTRPTRHFGIAVFLILNFNLNTRILILFCSRFWSSENISSYNKYA